MAKAGRIGISLKPSLVGGGVEISLAHNVHLHDNPFKDTPFGKHNYPVFSIVKGMSFILPQLPSVEALGAQTSNLIDASETYTAINKLDAGWREGLVGSYFFVDEEKFSSSTDGSVRNLRTRMWADREDPATGSAASALASYLSLQKGKAGRYAYRILQGVEMGQRSEIFVEVGVQDGKDGGVEIEEVVLSGSAVQVMQGTLEVPEA